MKSQIVKSKAIQNRIYSVRGVQVMLDEETGIWFNAIQTWFGLRFL